MVDEGHVNEQVDAVFVVQAHQVDVRRQVFDHVALHSAADHMHVRLAFNLEVEQRRQEAAGFQALQQGVVRDLDGQRGSVIAIDDTGNEAITT